MWQRLLIKIWPIIALAFPVLEIIGIVQIWKGIGGWSLLWLAGAVLWGAALIAGERAAFGARLAEAMLGGKSPVGLLFASGQRFLAGGLLILPGALSDLLALILLLRAGLPARPARSKTGAEGVIEGEFHRVD